MDQGDDGPRVLAEECEAFCKRWRMPRSHLGERATGDDKFVARLRERTDVGTVRAGQIRGYMKGYEQGRADEAAKPRKAAGNA